MQQSDTSHARGGGCGGNCLQGSVCAEFMRATEWAWKRPDPAITNLCFKWAWMMCGGQRHRPNATEGVKVRRLEQNRSGEGSATSKSV
eukprot:6505521-Alexandrium_andersonii.AAC.1